MSGQLEYSATPSSNTTVNGIGIQGSSTIKNGDDALRQLMADAAASITRHVAKSVGSYTALKADFRQLWRATGAVTINLTAAATLTNGWCLFVKADGGDVTVDPNGSEQINGSATALTVGNGSSAFIFCTGTAFYAISIGDVTLAGTQTLTNKTLTSPTITTPTLTLKQSATPAPTASGDIQFGTTNKVIEVGDGGATKTFVPIPAGTVAGDLEYFTSAKVKARLAKGTASQALRMNPGATAPEWADILTLGTAVTASGTAIDFTGLPAGVKTITINFVGVSTNGTDNWLIQIGDSGGIENTGYLGTSNISFATGNDIGTYTAGFGIRANASATVINGTVTLFLANASTNTWTASGVLGWSNQANLTATGGSKALSATLDRLRITTSGGVNTYDAGILNITYGM